MSLPGPVLAMVCRKKVPCPQSPAPESTNFPKMHDIPSGERPGIPSLHVDRHSMTSQKVALRVGPGLFLGVSPPRHSLLVPLAALSNF